MKLNFILSFFCLSLLVACDSGNTTSTSNSTDTSPTTTPSTQAPSDPAKPTAPNAKDNTVVSWVDKLNIRQQPNMKSKIVAQAKENESLTKTGEQSDFTETIELRGQSYTEPWIQVKTTDGHVGWVFGGAVKKVGEDKGNPLNTARKFSYPHFGAFDLNEWTKSGNRNDGGEELDATTTIYKKGNQTLEITDSSMGEMFWGKSYTLKDADDKVLKERSVRINAVNGNILTESVKDYTSNPAKEYIRENELKKHFYQINPKPDMATGQWTVNKLDEI